MPAAKANTTKKPTAVKANASISLHRTSMIEIEALRRSIEQDKTKMAKKAGTFLAKVKEALPRSAFNQLIQSATINRHSFSGYTTKVLREHPLLLAQFEVGEFITPLQELCMNHMGKPPHINQE